MKQSEFKRLMARLQFTGIRTVSALEMILVRNKTAREATDETGCDPAAISRALKKITTPVPAQPGFLVERDQGKWIVTENWDRA